MCVRVGVIKTNKQIDALSDGVVEEKKIQGLAGDLGGTKPVKKEEPNSFKTIF